MQKLDLRHNLDVLMRLLKSKEIVDKLNSQQPFSGRDLMNLFIESKSGFDQASTIESNREIFEQFNAPNQYTTEIFSALFAYATQFSAQQTHTSQFLSYGPINNFFAFHNALITTFLLVDKLLIHNEDFLNQSRVIDYDRAEESGTVTLQIIDDNNVSLQKLRTVIESLEKLIDTIYLMIEKIEDEKIDEKPEVSLIDSGSDISFSIKIPKKAANIVAQILKEAWDIMLNNKTFRHKQKVKAIKDSLTQYRKIEEAREKGKIDDHTAEMLKSGLTESTIRIIGTNTVNKKLLNEKTDLSNRKLLMEANKTFLLEEHNEDEQ